MQDDMVSGWVCLFIALMMLIFCLIALVTLLRKALLGASTQILYKATNINPFVAIVIGAGVTVFVQSSSITSSTLVPLAGIGVLDLENMFPLILGADRESAERRQLDLLAAHGCLADLLQNAFYKTG